MYFIREVIEQIKWTYGNRMLMLMLMVFSGMMRIDEVETQKELSGVTEIWIT